MLRHLEVGKRKLVSNKFSSLSGRRQIGANAADAFEVDGDGGDIGSTSVLRRAFENIG